MLVHTPKLRILLVRHGQSEANVDRDVYKRMSDHAICLSELGHQQAVDAGKGNNPIPQTTNQKGEGRAGEGGVAEVGLELHRQHLIFLFRVPQLVLSHSNR